MAALLLAAACTEPAFDHPDGELAGIWFGTRRDGANAVLWQTWKSADGAIEINFITCRRGELLQSEHQAGTWTYENGIYRTLISQWYIGDEQYSPNGGADAVDHEYRVLELNPDRIVYRHRETRQTYEMRRTDESFELGCDKMPRHEPRVRIDVPGELDARISRRSPDEAAGDDSDEAPSAPAQDSPPDTEPP